MTYSEKLRDPRWQKKRLEILNRDGFACRLCGDKETELHIHHKKYHGDPWEAKDENLETLCKDCHRFLEYFKKEEFGQKPPRKVIKINDPWEDLCNQFYGLYWFEDSDIRLIVKYVYDPKISVGFYRVYCVDAEDLQHLNILING